MIFDSHRGIRKARQGIAAVETAILLPFLFILMFGIWEVGQLLHVNEYVNNSAREGGRLAATGNYSGSSVLGSSTATTTTFDVQSAVGNYLQNCGLTIPSTGVNITVTNETQNLAMTGVASISGSNSTQVVITGSGTTPTADPILVANQFDIVRIDVQYPFSFARWSPNNLFFYLGSNPIITASTRWECLRDKAVSVDASIPASPLP